MKKKILFIVNPIAGTGRQKNIEGLIKETLDADLFDYSLCHTEHIHHGSELARDAADKGYDTVVAVGGDGSIHDVVQGLRGTDLSLGIVPCGSGNGLARALKIPLRPQNALRLLNEQHEECIDSITVNDSFVCINAAGVGFDAHIARIMKTLKHRGFSVYTQLVMREFSSYKPHGYQLTLDGQKMERGAWFIAIANGRQYGYNFSVAPKALMNDGQFDITILDRVPLDHIPITAPLAFMNLLNHSQHAEMFRGRDLLIEGNSDGWVNIDGEVEKLGKKIHFVINPLSVKLLGRKK